MRLDNIIALIGADRFIEIFINFSFLFLSIFLVIQGNIAADLSDAVLFVSLSLVCLIALLSLFLYKHRLSLVRYFRCMARYFRKHPTKTRKKG